MLQNLQLPRATKKSTGQMVGISMPAVQLQAMIALLLGLLLIPAHSGVA
jgi:hypothetical protein